MCVMFVCTFISMLGLPFQSWGQCGWGKGLSVRRHKRRAASGKWNCWLVVRLFWAGDMREGKKEQNWAGEGGLWSRMDLGGGGGDSRLCSRIVCPHHCLKKLTWLSSVLHLFSIGLKSEWLKLLRECLFPYPKETSRSTPGPTGCNDTHFAPAIVLGTRET